MRRFPPRLLLGLILGMALVSSQSPAVAQGLPAEDPHGGAAAKGEHVSGGKASPITADKKDVDLAVWTLVVFAVFVAVLTKFAWGPLTVALDKREQQILQNIADAETARIKAEKMLAAHAEKLDKVQDEVRAIIAEARRDAEHTKNDIIATAQKEAEATRQRAIADIERARDQALDELFAHMSQRVVEATESVVGRSLTGTDHERLIQEALTGFTQRRT